MAGWARVEVLVLDDLALRPLTDTQAGDLLEVIDDRHGRRSTIVTSQLPIAAWHDNLGDPPWPTPSAIGSSTPRTASSCAATPAAAPRTPPPPSPSRRYVTVLTRDLSGTYVLVVPDNDDDLVFRALADPTRRLLLDRLYERDGRTLGELETEVPTLTRFGVMKHLGVLEDAGLVVTRKDGRRKLHYLNPVPIREIADRWIDKYRAGTLDALLDLKNRLEGTT
jgi:DNA-binding transcriptional ArsR family regulator